MNARAIIFAVLVALIGCAEIGLAGAPKVISYQGRLTDELGRPVDTTVDLTFHIHADSEQVTPMWSENHFGVPVEDGLFTVLLGSFNPFPWVVFDGSPRYFGMQVGNGAEGQPLIPLASVAYAFHAFNADSAYSSTVSRYTDTAQFAEVARIALSGGGESYWVLDGEVLSTQAPFGLSRGMAGNGLYGQLVGTMTNLGTGCATGAPGQDYGYQTVGGGLNNLAQSWNSTVAGGDQNYALGNYTTIGGGQRNWIYHMYGTVGGGFGDTVFSPYGAALSGRRNVAGTGSLDTAAFVGGGSDNRALGRFAAVAGGSNNSASLQYTTVGGGLRNQAMGDFACVVGGVDGIAGSFATFVGGGTGNQAWDGGSTVTGGQFNQSRGWYSVIGGGLGNHVNGYASTIPGGSWDTLMASHSYLFGIRSKLTHDSTFMVDMPHIRFGDEADGYEFPAADGSAGQVLATNGNGILGWSSAASGAWADNGTRVQLTTVTDSVGIGLVAPAAPLHVYGSPYGVAMIEGGSAFASLDLKVSGGTKAELRKYSGGTVELATNSPSRLDLHTEEGGSIVLRVGSLHDIIMDSAGSVSIGAVGPKNQLDIGGTTVIGRHMAGLRYGPANGLAVEGNVGIGLPNPNRRLYVADSIPGLTYALKLDNPRSTVGSDGIGMLFSVGGDGGNAFDVDRGKGALVYTYENTWNRGNFHFLQDAGEDESNPTLADAVMTIKNNGNVGMGTTNPQDRLEVNGFLRLDNGVGGGTALRITEGGTLRWALLYRPWASHKLGFFDEQSARWALAFEPGSGEVGIGTDSPNYTLDVRGTIGNNATLYHSDLRWKQNIVGIEGALDKIARLRGVNYEWRIDEYAEMMFPEGKQVGLIAQEVEGVVPEIVSTDEAGYKSVDYAKLSAVLVEAVKELQKENEELKRRLEVLEEAQSGK